MASLPEDMCIDREMPYTKIARDRRYGSFTYDMDSGLYVAGGLFDTVFMNFDDEGVPVYVNDCASVLLHALADCRSNRAPRAAQHALGARAHRARELGGGPRLRVPPERVHLDGQDGELGVEQHRAWAQGVYCGGDDRVPGRGPGRSRRGTSAHFARAH